MSEFPADASLWGARLAGALAGVVMSLVYLLPKSRREAASRFVIGLVAGLLFGGPAGQWLVHRLELADSLTGSEVLLAGSALASLSAWWALGALARLAERFSSR